MRPYMAFVVIALSEDRKRRPLQFFVPPTEQEVTARIENEKCRGRRPRRPVVAIHVACGLGCRGRQPLQILTVFMVLSEGARNAPLHGATEVSKERRYLRAHTVRPYMAFVVIALSEDRQRRPLQTFRSPIHNKKYQ